MTLLLAVQVPDTDASIAAVQLGDAELLAQLGSDTLDAARFTAWYPAYISELRSRDSWPGTSLCATLLAEDAMRSAVAELSARGL